MRQNFLLLPQQHHLGKEHLPPAKVPSKLHKDAATTEISSSLVMLEQREDQFLEVSLRLNTSRSTGRISAAATSSVHGVPLQHSLLRGEAGAGLSLSKLSTSQGRGKKRAKATRVKKTKPPEALCAVCSTSVEQNALCLGTVHI